MGISAHRKSKSGPMALRLDMYVPKGLSRSRKVLVWPCDFFCACCEVQKPTLSRPEQFSTSQNSRFEGTRSPACLPKKL